jgi:hypothetical protein
MDSSFLAYRLAGRTCTEILGRFTPLPSGISTCRPRSPRIATQSYNGLRKSYPIERFAFPPSRCGLTPRSSGAPTAGHPAQACGTWCIIAALGLASCRRRPLSSNVRPAWQQRPSPSTRLAGASRLENLPARVGSSQSRHRQLAKARLRARLGSHTWALILALLHCCAAAQERRLEAWPAGWVAALPRAPGASQTQRLCGCHLGGARCAAPVRAGLTRHSTGPSTAAHLGPASAVALSCAGRAKLPCRSGPVSSNVRPRNRAAGSQAAPKTQRLRLGYRSSQRFLNLQRVSSSALHICCPFGQPGRLTWKNLLYFAASHQQSSPTGCRQQTTSTVQNP